MGYMKFNSNPSPRVRHSTRFRAAVLAGRGGALHRYMLAHAAAFGPDGPEHGPLVDWVRDHLLAGGRLMNGFEFALWATDPGATARLWGKVKRQRQLLRQESEELAWMQAAD